MAGRHSAKSSKKPLIVIACIIAALVIAGVICAVIFLSPNKNTNNFETTVNNSSTEAYSTANNKNTENHQSEVSTESESKSQDETVSGETSQPQKVVVPTKGGKVSYFSATYVPYKAVDTITNEECSLREVFGTSFASGVLTFNSDGTFTDTLTSSSANSGAYAVDSGSIVATYTNDKNMSVTVKSWDGDTPTELIVNYGGYDVYFNM